MSKISLVTTLCHENQTKIGFSIPIMIFYIDSKMLNDVEWLLYMFVGMWEKGARTKFEIIQLMPPTSVFES